MKDTIVKLVTDWFETRDFDKGIAILAIYRPQMARIMVNRPQTYSNKLEYELSKLAGIPWVKLKTTKIIPGVNNPAPKQPKPKAKAVPKPKIKLMPVVPPVVKALPGPPTPNPKQENKQVDKTTPPFITKIIKEHARLFKLRSQLGDQRQAIPQKNHPTLNKKRKVLSASIHELSTRIDMLFQAKEDYYNNGVKPDMDALFPAPLPTVEEKKTAPKTKK